MYMCIHSSLAPPEAEVLLANFLASLRPSGVSICWSVQIVEGESSAGTSANRALDSSLDSWIGSSHE